MEGKVCSKCGVWKPLEEYNKRKASKDGRRTECRKCQKECKKQYREKNKEYIKEKSKQYYEANKEKIKKRVKIYAENNAEKISERNKLYRKKNAKKIKEQQRQYRENNKDKIRETRKQWEENNLEKVRRIKERWYQNNYEKANERTREWQKNNIERTREKNNKWNKKNKQKNLQIISNIVKQTNPIFEKLNLPIYGYVYMFENIKTGHKYVGQTILPLKKRYKGSDVIRGWIKERLECDTQKFKEELIETDIVVTEALDVAFCQYHLDKLEAYYIDKYDSFLNGYNNTAGNHNTDDGIEEFNQILSENNLEFIDGKLVKIA